LKVPVAGGVSSREEDHAFPANLPTYEDDGDMNGPEASVDGVLSSCKSSSEGAEDGGATVSAEEDGDAPWIAQEPLQRFDSASCCL